ncbi:Hypothetical_protein [Hexamita inflata]|uniref:Hypothetical_protein n=1 Tax=Hexamita inflata TaxID=28002 RepID=A0AA86PUW9_9EUKA|nr:Hypothetical protein HINF_LOCUS31643 [Hexamita inflata]
MKNLPSFALFGLTKIIAIVDSNFQVKVPQPQLKSALICFQCDINSSTSEFAFVAQAQMISGLVYCPYTIMVLNSSLIQFRLTGLNVGGLIFNASNIQVQISFCNISGYVSNGSFSGVLIATATNSSTIEIQDVIICVQFNDIIDNNQIGSGADSVQISGNFIQSCDLCGSYYQYFTYGLCLEYLNFGEVVNNIIICLHSFVFNGEVCSCPDGLQIQGSKCVDVLEIIDSQDNQIKSLENTFSLMQDQIQQLQNSLNNLTQYLECVNKKGYQYINGSCNKQEIDFMECLTADKYISTFDISSITNQVGQTDFSNVNSVFRSQNFIQNAFINVQDAAYNSVAIPLFESQLQFNNIKIQIGTQSIETGSILTASKNITVNQMKIVSREQTSISVNAYLNIFIAFSVSSTINNLQVNLSFEAQNGNITLIDHVTGTLNISGYQVLGVIQSLQIVAMIGIYVEQAVLNLQNINYNPIVHNAGNLSSYLLSYTIQSQIQVVNINIELGSYSNYSIFGQIQTNIRDSYVFGGIIAYSNNSDININSIIFDSYIEIQGDVTIENSGFIVGYSQSTETGSIILNSLCLQLTFTSLSQTICDFGFIGANEGNISLKQIYLSQQVILYNINGHIGIVGQYCQQDSSSLFIYSEISDVTIISNISMKQNELMDNGTVSVIVGEFNGQNCQIMNINIIKCDISLLFRNSFGIIIGLSDQYNTEIQYNISIVNTIITCNLNSEKESGGLIKYLYKLNVIIQNSVFTCNQSGYEEFGGFIQEIEDCNTTIINSQFTNSTVQNIIRFSGFIYRVWGNATIVDSCFTNNTVFSSLDDMDKGCIAGFIADQYSNAVFLRLLINQINIQSKIDTGGFMCYEKGDSVIENSIIENSNLTGQYVGAICGITNKSNQKVINSSIINVNLNGSEVAVFCALPQDGNISIMNSNVTNVNLNGSDLAIFVVQSENNNGTISISNCFTKNVSLNGVLQKDTE